jgi:histidine triad (HIT) family protein
MEDCLFCKIAAKKIPAEIIYEDEHSVAFLDINPRSPGHTMVISKYHSRDLLDLPEQELSPLFSAVKRVTGQIAKTLAPAGFIIGINHGAVSGQTIEHLHIHIVPRFKGDGGSSVHSVVYNPPKESLEAIAYKIKNQK